LGNDTLVGGLGADTLDGGTGDDIFSGIWIVSAIAGPAPLSKIQVTLVEER
jgi:Ca2+-binding RTX toxin-like protein